MESPGAGQLRRRLTRILAGVLLVPLVGLVLVLLVAVALLHSLDRPWLKQRIASQVEAATGLQLDYQAAEVSLLSGLRLQGLVVRTPPPFQHIAPELLRVGSLEARWSPGALMSRTPRVDFIAVREVALVWVADEAGPTSLSGLPGQQAPEPPPAEAPLGASRQLAALLSSAPPFGHVEVSNVSLGYVRVRKGEVLERWDVRGLALAVEAKPQDGGWRLFANAGQRGTPLPLELRREGPALPSALAALELALSAEAGAADARARVDLDVARQTFEPKLTLRSLLHGGASAKFDGEKQHIALELERTRLADGAEVQAQLVLPDAADVPPVLKHALAEVDLGRVLQWVPAEWLPFSLERGKVHLDARDVTLSAMPQLGAGGSLGLDVDVSALQLAQEGLHVELGGGRISLVATPDAPRGLAARVTFALQGLGVRGPTTLRAPKVSGELKGQQLRPDLASSLQVAGDVSLSGKVESLDVRASGLRATAEGLGFGLQAALAGEPPFRVKADVPVRALRVLTEGREVLKGPVHVKLDVSDAFPHWDDPRRSRARARVELDVGSMHTSLDATKGADDVAYTLSLRTPDLVAARPFLPEDVAARLPWRQLGVSLASTGTVTALFSPSPRVAHRTELRLQRPGWDDVSATNVAIVARSQGDVWRHKGDVDLQVEGLRVGEKDAGPQHQTLTVDVDRRKPSLKLGLKSHAGLKAALDAALAFDRKARTLQCDVKADVSPDAVLSLLLARAQVPAALDSTRLALNVELHGTLSGVLTDVAADGTPRLTPAPLRTAGFEGQAVVDARGIRWRQEGQSLNVPALRWQVDSHVDGPRREVHSQLTLERLSLGQSDRRLTFSNVSSDTTATFTEQWEAGESELRQRLKVGAFEQRPALPYPVQDVEVSLSARRKANGVVHIPDVQLSHPGTGTHLKVQGRLDLSDNRRLLALRGQLEQDLSRLAQPERLESSGRAVVDFQVASPDLTVFRTQSNILLQNVNVRLPAAGFAIQALDGSVPVTENVQLTESGVRLLSDVDMNPYSMLRYADQHPLLSRSGFMSVGSITTPLISIAPLAGNLAINQNMVAMSQLEMGVRGGNVTGQWVLDWQGRHSTLEAHVRATGVQSSRGEPFDGNAAVVISGKDRSVNGRAEILRIGNRHLLDLLDLEDPQHSDPASNRVRYALRLGYPEHVRVSFNHGFGRLSITMGGLARMLSIDEIRGIPMGPIIDRAIESMFPPETPP
jgi:translocation and assembly module TamB